MAQVFGKRYAGKWPCGAWLVLVVCLGVVSACSRSSDEGSQAYIQAVVAKSGSEEALKVQIEAMRNQLRDLKDQLSDHARSTKDQIATDVASLATRLKTIDTSVEDGATAARGIEADLKRLAGRIEALESLRGSLQKLQDFDPAAFATMSTRLAEKEGEILRVAAERDAAHTAIEELKRRAETLQNTEATLREELAHVSGADISRHPMLLELRKEMGELKDKLRGLQQEYDKTVLLAKDLQRQLDEAAQGKPATAEPATGPHFDPAFDAVVKLADFMAVSQQWNILADLGKGTMPKPGDRLSVVSKDGKLVCEMKVTRIFDEKQFGGITIDATAERLPAEGDQVLRTASAENASASTPTR